MSLINKIKADQIEARKHYMAAKSAALGRPSGEPSKNSKSALLTTLLGEASIIGKNAGRETTDDEVIAVVKKFIKNIDECLSVEKVPLRVLELNLEKAELNMYLPKQFTKEQMLGQIVNIRTNKGSKLEMKDVMQAFKAQFAGSYDGKVLSEVTKEYLAVQV